MEDFQRLLELCQYSYYNSKQLEGIQVKKYLLIITVFGALLLAGCSFNASTKDKVSKVLGEMYDAEGTYRDSQKELKVLEEEEQKLFTKTMELTQEEKDQLEENIAQLQEIVEERTEKIEQEKEAMEKAKEMVSDFDKIEEKLETAEQKEIEKLKEAVRERYETHTSIVDEYEALTAMQKELYNMLVEEETNITTLNEQVGKINEQNEKVITAIKEFNEQTENVNEIRDEVYSKLKENNE